MAGSARQPSGRESRQTKRSCAWRRGLGRNQAVGAEVMAKGIFARGDEWGASISAMDLKAPNDDVPGQEDRASTAEPAAWFRFRKFKWLGKNVHIRFGFLANLRLSSIRRSPGETPPRQPDSPAVLSGFFTQKGQNGCKVLFRVYFIYTKGGGMSRGRGRGNDE